MIGACPFFSAISPTRAAASASLPRRPAKPYSLHCFAGFKLSPARWRTGALKDAVEVDIGADDAADVAKGGVIGFSALESEMEGEEVEEKDGCDSVGEVFGSKKKKDDVPEVKDYDRFKMNNGREVFEEKAYLVGVECKGREVGNFGIEESLKELAQLADTAGLLVVGSTHQKLAALNPKTYIGSGKVAEIKSAVHALDVETVIFDDELSAGQLRNLEKAFGGDVRVCDRTALILDIFNQRAATHEAALQAVFINSVI